MKHTKNNEIDLLLRSLAKREGSRSASSTSGSAIQPSDAHLDADELNSFAEHTLPAATRARYMSHVVDCTRCRQIVTELTAAAGLPVFKIQSEQKVSSFWQSLGAFLSPAVLRYAVPALAILAVITVGLLTLRQQTRTDFVAQNQDTPSLSVPESKTDQPGNAATQSPVTRPSNLPLKAPESPANTTARPAKAGEEVGTTAGQTTDSVSGLMAKDAPKSSIVTDGQRASPPTFAPEPGAAPPPPVQMKPASPAEVSKNEVLAKQKEQQPQAGLAAREMRDERGAEDKEAAMSRSRKAAAAGRGGLGIQTMEARRGEAESKRADEDSQTRSVEGRRFRRQGNVWVDTAYEGSRPTTTVVRGSEQYRALVADEPGIRLIAEKLSGEVVLIWKGRAYRIR